MKVLLLVCLGIAVACASPAKRQFCGPVCMIYCPFGNVLDSKGCPTCSCNWPSTQAPKDAPARRQILKHCDFSNLALCDLWCPSGKMAHDANGCTLCKCDNSHIIV